MLKVSYYIGVDSKDLHQDIKRQRFISDYRRNKKQQGSLLKYSKQARKNKPFPSLLFFAHFKLKIG